MRKIFIFMCIAAMLTGCGGSSSSTAVNNTTVQKAEEEKKVVEEDNASGEKEVAGEETAVETDKGNNESKSEKIDVFIKPTGILDGDNLKFEIETNLPDESKLMATLSQGEYKMVDGGTIRSTEGTVQEGKASFDLFGKDLSGNYDLSISMSLAASQPKSVQDVIGSHGENLSGDLIDTYYDDNTVDSYFSCFHPRKRCCYRSF